MSSGFAYSRSIASRARSMRRLDSPTARLISSVSVRGPISLPQFALFRFLHARAACGYAAAPTVVTGTMSRQERQGRRCERPGLGSEVGQTLVLLAGACLVLLLFVGVLGALGKALLDRGRLQRAADLAAVSAASSMRDDFPRLFERGQDRLSKDAYLARARAAALAAARSNGAELRGAHVVFPDVRSFAPTSVRVSLRDEL